MPETYPPHLHILLARESPMAVVIRRGPSHSACTIGWDRRTDTFAMGQWFRGRIYERRSDLSPDGRFMIYFAFNGKRHLEGKGSWTAISYAPYLKALALYAKGDAWRGGGLFTSNNRFWLNDGYGHDVVREWPELEREPVFPGRELYNSECLGVYYNRLQRDGWEMLPARGHSNHDTMDYFFKRLNKTLVLRKIAHAGSSLGRPVYYDEHEILSHATLDVEAHPDRDWADYDGQRLLWTTEGRLFAASVAEHGIADATQLHDFNDMKFERRQAPY